MSRLRAWSLIRTQPWYRHEAFLAGLTAAGYQALRGQPSYPIRAGEVLVTWNRYGDVEPIADRFEAAGGTVLVAENGYLGRSGGTPKFDVAGAAGPQPGHYYALARHGHNGAGTWEAGDAPRFPALDVALAPWRHEGEHILVCPNRTFGMRGMVMPYDWVKDTVAALNRATRRPIRVRAHPGNHAPAKPLATDLAGAWACVIWSSSAGVHALAAGVPVLCTAPHWVLKDCAEHDLARAEAPRNGVMTREDGFERLAWAQWTIEEIASGEPFRSLAAGLGEKDEKCVGSWVHETAETRIRGARDPQNVHACCGGGTAGRVAN